MFTGQLFIRSVYCPLDKPVFVDFMAPTSNLDMELMIYNGKFQAFRRFSELNPTKVEFQFQKEIHSSIWIPWKHPTVLEFHENFIEFDPTRFLFQSHQHQLPSISKSTENFLELERKNHRALPPWSDWDRTNIHLCRRSKFNGPNLGNGFHLFPTRFSRRPISIEPNVVATPLRRRRSSQLFRIKSDKINVVGDETAFQVL